MNKPARDGGAHAFDSLTTGFIGTRRAQADSFNWLCAFSVWRVTLNVIRRSSHEKKDKLFFAFLWLGALGFLMTPWSNPQAGPKTSSKKIVAPKIWDRKALSSWATPIAGINMTPTYYTEEEYYGGTRLLSDSSQNAGP
jgi:hypothetical protein